MINQSVNVKGKKMYFFIKVLETVWLGGWISREDRKVK